MSDALPTLLSAAALVSVRVGGLMLIAPIFSATTIPAHLRAALGVLLTALLVPLALAAGPAPALSAAAFVAEAMVGFVIGFGAAVLIGAADVAGDVLAMQTGLSSANTLDPFTKFGAPTLGQFFQLFVVTLVVALGGHLLMLRALAMSFDFAPLGVQLDWTEGLAAMVRTGSLLFALGLRFAAPVLGAVLIANVALGVLSRAAPKMNMLAVAFPLQIGLGLLVLGTSIPLIAAFYVGFEDQYGTLLVRLLDAFGVGG